LLLAFSLSLDDTIISTFVNVAGTTPWPVFVFSAVRSVLRPEIAAVSTLMLGVTMIAVFSVFMVLRRSGDSTLAVTKTLVGQ
jgi:putrescine transport system permease protein